MTLPSVYAYLDYRSFLRDWFEARKREDEAYSYSTFAREAGCSRSALANVLGGARNPRASTLDAFAQGMSLSPSERNYLGLLVDLASAEDMESRREAMERILATDRYQQVRLAENESETDLFRYVEHWWIAAIRELAALPEFRDDPEWIAGVLRPKITVEQARDGLARLFDLDFLHRRDDGTVEPRQVRFRSEPEAGQEAILYFHREVVPKLLRGMVRRPAEEQHVTGATITVPVELVPELKARLESVMSQVLGMADAAERDGQQRVYQLAIQLMPLSEPLG